MTVKIYKIYFFPEIKPVQNVNNINEG